MYKCILILLRGVTTSHAYACISAYARIYPFLCWNNPYSRDSIGGGDDDLTLQLVVGFESCLWEIINS
jgi:hypothetical protein